jgi:hypothetical protein
VHSEPGKGLPKAPARLEPPGIPAQTLATRIDQFLSSRGYRPPDGRSTDGGRTSSSSSPPTPPDTTPLDFVAESDVRDAVRAGRTLLIGEKTIVTPAARELGDEKKVFVQAGWPR